MNELLTFDDVLIVPKFSTISSRKDVTLETKVGGITLTLPVISSNMDTITEVDMCKAMADAGAIGCLHRFASIEDTVKMFSEAHRIPGWPMVSIGLGPDELRRAVTLYEVGATHFIIDVAHGAQQTVVDQANNLRGIIPRAYIVVGNFASAESVKEVLDRTFGSVNAVKVGVGPGSACTTRIKTGVGYPQFSAIKEIAALLKNTDVQVIADGGMRTPGDIAKALGAGAHLVMLGGMLAGTDETPGVVIDQDGNEGILKHGMWSRNGFITLVENVRFFKKYRGSASHESYGLQGKTGTHRTAEGESFLVPYKGPVANILADIEGGLRSAMTYVGARDLDEFRGRCEFVQISPATVRENGAHGKT